MVRVRVRGSGELVFSFFFFFLSRVSRICDAKSGCTVKVHRAKTAEGFDGVTTGKRMNKIKIRLVFRDSRGAHDRRCIKRCCAEFLLSGHFSTAPQNNNTMSISTSFVCGLKKFRVYLFLRSSNTETATVRAREGEPR
jgi:hypothetical protein